MMPGDFAALERATDRVDAIAARLAAVDGLKWDETCAGEQPDGDAGDCDSSTCVAAHYEDHDPAVARAAYRRYARTALWAIGAQDIVTERVVLAAHAAWLIALGKLGDAVTVVMTTEDARVTLHAAIKAAFAASMTSARAE